MKLKDIALSEISHSQRTTTVWFHVYELPRYKTEIYRYEYIETESRRVVARGWGGGNGELFNEHRVSVLHDEKVLEIGCTMM